MIRESKHIPDGGLWCKSNKIIQNNIAYNDISPAPKLIQAYACTQESAVRFQARARNFLFSKASTPAPGPTPPFVRKTKTVLSSEAKRLWYEAEYSLSSGLEANSSVSIWWTVRTFSTPYAADFGAPHVHKYITGYYKSKTQLSKSVVVFN